MINPTGIFRLVGFINETDSSLELTPQDGNKAFCYSDDGAPIIVKFESNKKDLTKEDVIRFLDFKRDGVIKDKDVELLASELEYVEEYESLIQEEVAKIESTDKKEILKKTKEIKMNIAREILKEKRGIQKNSILRSALSAREPLDTYTFKGNKYPLYVSRSIMFDDKGDPSISGLYYYSQLSNALPISIRPVFNKDGEALQLFSISLSKIANINHFNTLIEHIKRTVLKNKENNEKTYVQLMQYDYEQIKKNEKAWSVIKKLSEFSKQKELEADAVDGYLAALDELKVLMNENPRLMVFIQMPFNLMVKPDFMKEVLKSKKSPFSKLSDTMVSLNFSKEDPSVKKEKSAKITEFLNDLCKGEEAGDLNCIYHLPALRLSEDPDSWGFMANNIQVDQMVPTLKTSKKVFSLVGENK